MGGAELRSDRGAVRPALLPAPGGSRVALTLAVVIGTAGAVLAAYVAHLAHPATADPPGLATRATSVVRVSAVTAPLITAVVTAAPTSAVQGVIQLVVPGSSTKRSGTAAAVGNSQLVTSAQMVAGVTHVTAVMADGTEQDAKVVWVDQASGTAVLELAQPTPTLASGQAATLDPGDAVTAAGSNIAGEVLAVGVEATADDGTHMAHLLRLRMEAEVTEGAVLLDEGGRAVGICIGHDTDDETALLAAPIELARAATGTPGPDGTRRLAWLGLTGRSARAGDGAAPAGGQAADPGSTTSVDPTASETSTTDVTGKGAPATSDGTTASEAPPTAQPELPAAPPTSSLPPAPIRGAYVVAVDADGPAATAGVQEGDVVIAVDDIPVSSMNALILLVRERTVGRRVHLTLVRAGVNVELDTILSNRPAA